jgi:dolichol-phosphate mannosyltransferase
VGFEGEILPDPSLTVVIPVFNEEENLPEVFSRILPVLDGLSHSAGILFVDDGSTDQSAALIKEKVTEDQRIQLIQLSRNFGHQAALAAGIDFAGGDALILMDGDLQDKPEAIPAFIEAWQAGADVAYAIRTSRQESGLKACCFTAFYRLLRLVSGIQQPPDAGIFGLIDRKVVDEIKGMKEHNRYFPGLRAYAGFEQVGVEVDRDARFDGSPRVGLKGLVKLAFDALFSFSFVPLRIISVVGVIVAFGSFLYILRISYEKYIAHTAISGWPSILGAVLFIGGLQLVMLGIVGEYVGRIYEETKQRKLYIVKNTVNLPAGMKES